MLVCGPYLERRVFSDEREKHKPRALSRATRAPGLTCADVRGVGYSGDVQLAFAAPVSQLLRVRLKHDQSADPPSRAATLESFPLQMS